MTDTRLPGRWLTDVKFEELSDRAWRTFCGSLMWSNEQGTDGDVPKRAMKYLHPDGVDARTRSELLSSRLWMPNGDGVKVANWTATQSTAEELNAKRAANRDRQRKHRAAAKSATHSSAVTRDVMRDVTGESLGQDRQGQERTGQETSEALEPQNSGALSWPVRTPGDRQFHDDNSEEPF